jgi:hypothetical protein
MVIDPAMLACSDDSCANAGQVKGGKRNDEQEAFKGARRGKFAALELEVTRFLV